MDKSSSALVWNARLELKSLRFKSKQFVAWHYAVCGDPLNCASTHNNSESARLTNLYTKDRLSKGGHLSSLLCFSSEHGCSASRRVGQWFANEIQLADAVGLLVIEQETWLGERNLFRRLRKVLAPLSQHPHSGFCWSYRCQPSSITLLSHALSKDRINHAICFSLTHCWTARILS